MMPKKDNQEQTRRKPKLLKILILILVIIGILVFVWTLNYYFTVKADKEKTSPITPSPTSTGTPAPTANATITPTPTATPTPTPVESSTSFTTAIQIIGDDDCVSDTQSALSLLKRRAPAHYSATIEYVGILECISQGSGIWVWENPPRYKVGDATRETGALWYASTFPHEACHTKQYRDGREYLGELAETECLNAQYSALEQMGADKDLLDYVRNQASTKYWEVPYEDRWW